MAAPVRANSKKKFKEFSELKYRLIFTMRLGKCVFVTVLCEVNLLNHPKQQQQNQQHSQCQADHSCVQVQEDNHQGIQKLFKQEQEFELTF